jgi:hypothetical protein
MDQFNLSERTERIIIYTKYLLMIIFTVSSSISNYYFYKFIIAVFKVDVNEQTKVSELRDYFVYCCFAMQILGLLIFLYSIAKIWRFFNSKKHLRANEKIMIIQLLVGLVAVCSKSLLIYN